MNEAALASRDLEPLRGRRGSSPEEPEVASLL